MLRSLVLAALVVLTVEIASTSAAKDQRYYCDGACNVVRERCSCKASCVDERKCCTDYRESCNGSKSWKDTECSAESEMTCPDGYKSVTPVVVLSIDGYRDIYFNRNYTPTLKKLANCGVKAPYMRSAYPTKTFPNHYTIATGLYPESHGIVSNTIFDHETGQKFRPGRPASFSPHWWGGQPIWVSASNNGLKSATYFWPGGEINNTRYPDYFEWYNQSVPLEERAYQLFDWLDLPEAERPSIIMLYNHIVDSAGHKFGPFKGEINDSLVQADEMVEMIMNGLRDRGLDGCIDFLVTSDHGMASVDCTDKFVYLEDYGVDPNEVTYDLGPFGRIGKSMNESLWSKFDPVDTMNKLKCKQSTAHWEAYLKTEYLPKRYHYAYNKWIEDVHLVMDDEWWSGVKGDEDCDAGGHGYDNAYADMRAFFTAHGSSFKRSYVKSEPFENIEVYNLMADLLGIPAAPNNGTAGSLYDVMRSPPQLVKESSGIQPRACSSLTSNNNDLDCTTCQNVSQAEVETKLNISEAQAQVFEKNNMPYGRPRIFRTNAMYCVLAQESYVSTFDFDRKMPILSSFILTENEALVTSPGCVLRDSRVDNAGEFSCSSFGKEDDRGVSWTFLRPIDISGESINSEASISSNLIPTYKPFAEIWSFVSGKMVKWAKDYGGITVDVGPIFDYNYDGHFDTDAILKSNATQSSRTGDFSSPVPTHFFLVATRCQKGTGTKKITECYDSLSEIEVFSFIIPNFKEAPCHEAGVAAEEWIPRALLAHVARIKDIELLTGISFFTKWMTEEASQEDVAMAIRKKLYLPETSDSWVEDFLSQGGASTTAQPPVTTTSGAAVTSPFVPGLFAALMMSFVTI